jgi:hypothetical protein
VFATLVGLVAEFWKVIVHGPARLAGFRSLVGLVEIANDPT